MLTGTTVPQTCPVLQFIDKEGAGDVSECQPCPAGRICPQNSTVSVPCWPGYYCAVSNVRQFFGFEVVVVGLDTTVPSQMYVSFEFF